MPDPFYLFSKWWKQILAVLVLSLTIASTIVFMQPVKYLSIATALPAHPGANDKASIFNQQIQQLYGPMGSADELDKIVGTAQLDTIYLAVTDLFNLYDHYKVSDDKETARFKAARLLKKNTRVQKSAYGELRVKTWDTDKDLAPQLANALMKQLAEIHLHLQGETNQSVLISLLEGKKKLQNQLDTLLNNTTRDSQRGATLANNSRISTINSQLQQYDQLLGEYQLVVDSRPAVLRIVEPARAAAIPDSPKPYLVIGVTAILSLVFAFLLALLLENRKKKTA